MFLDLVVDTTTALYYYCFQYILSFMVLTEDADSCKK